MVPQYVTEPSWSLTVRWPLTHQGWKFFLAYIFHWLRERELQVWSAKMRWYMTQVWAGGTWTLVLLPRGRLSEKLSLRTWCLNLLKEMRSQTGTEHTGTHCWGQGGSGRCWSRFWVRTIFYLLCPCSSANEIPTWEYSSTLCGTLLCPIRAFLSCFYRNNV